jgi:hypothetical protein
LRGGMLSAEVSSLSTCPRKNRIVIPNAQTMKTKTAAIPKGRGGSFFIHYYSKIAGRLSSTSKLWCNTSSVSGVTTSAWFCSGFPECFKYVRCSHRTVDSFDVKRRFCGLFRAYRKQPSISSSNEDLPLFLGRLQNGGEFLSRITVCIDLH